MWKKGEKASEADHPFSPKMVLIVNMTYKSQLIKNIAFSQIEIYVFV